MFVVIVADGASARLWRVARTNQLVHLPGEAIPQVIGTLLPFFIFWNFGTFFRTFS
jgi:hypothetical protein